MKKLLITLLFVVSVLNINAQDSELSWNGDTLNVTELVSEINGMGQIVDTIAFYKDAKTGRSKIERTINETNNDLVYKVKNNKDLSGFSDNTILGVEWFQDETRYFEELYASYIIQEYYKKIGVWNVSGFIGQNVRAYCLTGAGKKFISSKYKGELPDGTAIVKQYKGVYRECDENTILPK